MAALNLILKSLSKKDQTLLQKKIDKGTKKALLLSLIIDHPDQSDSFFAQKLDYSENSSSFATLKHRFIDEITSILLESNPNPFVKINQRVAVIKSSIYSAHELLFEHEMSRCYKLAKRLEAFEALYQILKLSLYHAKRRFASSNEIEKIEKELLDMKKVRKAVNYVETAFFSNLFDYNINVFHVGKEDLDFVNKTLEPIRLDFGNYSTVSFLVKSLQLDMMIKSNRNNNVDVHNEIDELLKHYKSSNLHYKYPMAEIGLYALKNKFQYLNGEKKGFQTTFNYIWNNIYKIADKNMYLGVNLYLLFAIHLQFINEQISKEELDSATLMFARSKHPLIDTAICFFQACLYFIDSDFSKSYNLILKSRQFLNLNIRKNSSLPMEIGALGLICQLKQKDYLEASLSYEVNALRYLISKNNITKSHPLHQLLDLGINEVKHGVRSKSLSDELDNIIEQLRRERICLLIN